MVIGDIVVHNTFPPVQGVVTIVQPSEYIESKLGVLRFDTKTLFYDLESTWDRKGNIQDYQSVVESESISQPEYQEFIEIEEDNIIDAEFREID